MSYSQSLTVFPPENAWEGIQKRLNTPTFRGRMTKHHKPCHFIPRTQEDRALVFTDSHSQLLFTHLYRWLVNVFHLVNECTTLTTKTKAIVKESAGEGYTHADSNNVGNH